MTPRRYTIRFSSCYPNWPWRRQLPGARDSWGQFDFDFTGSSKSADFWVVYEGLSQVEECHIPPNRTLLITGEPPSIKMYSGRFVRQFAQVLTCHPKLRHPGLILDQQALPWHVGAQLGLTYDSFLQDSTSNKTRLISVITSNKASTVGHRKRLDLIEQLKNHFGEKLEIFGRGIRPVDDKWEALSPFKYHLVLENSFYPDYWTEKLADSYLALAFPFVAGCPNLGEYFSEKSFQPISVSDPAGTIEKLEIALRQDWFTQRLDALRHCKRQILDEYNLFAVVTRWAASTLGKGHPEPAAQALQIRPEFNGVGKWLHLRNRWVARMSSSSA